MKREFALIAHRGWPDRYPENTIASLSAALEAGARHLEFDVQLSADGVPHLFHDGDLKRITGAEGAVVDLGSTALAGLNAGERGRFGDRFPDVGIASLTEAVALLSQWPGVRAFVEIKVESFARFTREEVLDAVTTTLEPVLERCVIISFDHDLVAAAQRLNGVPTGWILRSLESSVRCRAEELVPGYLFINRKRFAAGEFTPWPGPWRWAVYTVDDAVTAREMGELGFDLIETNRIGPLLTDLVDPGEG